MWTFSGNVYIPFETVIILTSLKFFANSLIQSIKNPRWLSFSSTFWVIINKFFILTNFEVFQRNLLLSLSFQIVPLSPDRLGYIFDTNQGYSAALLPCGLYN